jgi:hypothetical protein
MGLRTRLANPAATGGQASSAVTKNPVTSTPAMSDRASPAAKPGGA